MLRNRKRRVPRRVEIRGLLKTMRRPRYAAAATAVIAAAGVFAISAFAVHDFTFQLDGDVSASTGGNSTQTIDWSSIFTTAGANQSPLPAGFSAAKFEKDFLTSGTGTSTTFVTKDFSTYATGSKDTLPISSGWECNADNNVNSKTDVMNAYAAAYTAPGGDQVVYFGLERNVNTGTANVGFWFLQDDVGCTTTSGRAAFTGDHRDGDLLIVSEFSNGGTVSTINVYRWDGGANGSLRTTPVATGADCRTTLANDPVCATSNTTANGIGGTITTPWLTANAQDKVGNKLRTSEFFEGGLNLTDSDLDGKCFNVFIGDTRSSTSLTATLFDYARGKIGQCSSTTVTTPKTGAGDNIPAAGLTIPGDPADAALSVKDSADIQVTGVQTFDGTVAFSLCGPLAAGSTTTCSNSPNVSDTVGVSVGSPQAVTASGTVVSPAATVTSAGRYCWRAVFSGDANKGVPGSSDSSASECFLVNPLQATITTDAGADTVDFGSAVTDTATLANTAHKPGTGSTGSINPTTPGGEATGTITFRLFNNATCNGDPVYTTTIGTVSGNDTYGPVSFIPTAPGIYYWVANYGGDPPNTLANVPSACNDAAERVEVRQIPTEIKTKQSWYPNDTAQVSVAIGNGNLAANGTVVFSLYDNPTCTGTAQFAQTRTLTGGARTETVSTTNTTFPITTSYDDTLGSTTGLYSWKVVYTPATSDTAHTGRQSTCSAEQFNTTYKNDAGPGTLFPDPSP